MSNPTAKISKCFFPSKQSGLKEYGGQKSIAFRTMIVSCPKFGEPSIFPIPLIWKHFPQPGPSQELPPKPSEIAADP